MNINKLLIIYLFSLSVGAQQFPTAAEYDLMRWAINITKHSNLTSMQSAAPVRIDKSINNLEATLLENAPIIALLAQDDKVAELLFDILNGLCGQEGEQLRTILRDAARCPEARKQLLLDMKWEICSKQEGLWSGPDLADLYYCGAPGALWDLKWKICSNQKGLWDGLDPADFYHCGVSPVDLSKFWFSKTDLKANIDALEARMEELLGQCFDKSWLDRPRDLDDHEDKFKLFVALEPRLHELIDLAIRYAQFLVDSNKHQKHLSELELPDLNQILISIKKTTDTLIKAINISKD